MLLWCYSLLQLFSYSGHETHSTGSSSNDNEISLKLQFQNLPRSAILRYEISRQIVHDVLKRCRKFVSMSSTLQVVLLFALWPLMAFPTVCHLRVVALLFRFAPRKPAQRNWLQPKQGSHFNKQSFQQTNTEWKQRSRLLSGKSNIDFDDIH